jgi:hypothetical protein
MAAVRAKCGNGKPRLEHSTEESANAQ